MNSIVNQPTRRLILNFVTSHPATSAREVQRSLSLGWGETTYHLEHLLNLAVIERERAGRRDFFFNANVRPSDRRVLIAFQSQVERTVLLLLTQKPNLSFGEVTDCLNMNKSTLSFHLKYLMAANIVGVSMIGGVRRYHAEQPTRVWELYSKYRASWGSRWIERFSSVFGGLLTD
jgi:predicted transcriptional regulator